jgi:hypothetical protein
MLLPVVVREVQVPLLASMLLGGCAAKLAAMLRTRSAAAVPGPTVLFPAGLRRPVAVAMCACEFVLGVGLILTAGRIGRGAPTDAVRLGTALLFLVATGALIELRGSRPDAGCGCFGDFSTAPVSGRALARSALLAVAALTTVGLPPLRPPMPGVAAILPLGLFAAELAVIAMLSPEVGEGLIRLGYSEPCELRVVPAARTVTALHRSSQWRRHASLITAAEPADMWRELCWRYVAYPGEENGRQVEVVFAVFLRKHRPAIQAAVVDAAIVEAAVVEAASGPAVPPATAAIRPAGDPGRIRPLVRVPAPALSALTDPGLGIPAARGAGAGDLPLSRDL